MASPLQHQAALQNLEAARQQIEGNAAEITHPPAQGKRLAALSQLDVCIKSLNGAIGKQMDFEGGP